MQSAYMQVLSETGGLRLDPRTKILMLMAINISAFSVQQWYVMALSAMIPLTILVLRKKIVTALLCSSLLGFSLSMHMVFIDTTTTWVSILGAMISGMVNRMGPGLVMGYYLLSSTSVSEFIAAMQRLHVPMQLTIPLSVMFRFFPTIKEEATAIHSAMRMRDIRLGSSRGNLLALLEYRLIPLFVSCVKIGEELSCAALTRGLGGPVKRTNVCRIGFGIHDAIYGVATLLLCLLYLLVKRT